MDLALHLPTAPVSQYRIRNRRLSLTKPDFILLTWEDFKKKKKMIGLADYPETSTV